MHFMMTYIIPVLSLVQQAWIFVIAKLRASSGASCTTSNEHWHETGAGGANEALFVRARSFAASHCPRYDEPSLSDGGKQMDLSPHG
jgi:hypothetical protein